MIASHLYDTECKFCRIPLQVEIADCYIELQDKMLGDIPELVKMAACTTCADYEVTKRKICDVMAKAARTLGLEIYGNRGQSDLATLARQNMGIVFDRWCEHVACHHRIETVRDKTFINDLTEKPENWWRVMSLYEKMIVKEKTRPGWISASKK